MAKTINEVRDSGDVGGQGQASDNGMSVNQFIKLEGNQGPRRDDRQILRPSALEPESNPLGCEEQAVKKRDEPNEGNLTRGREIEEHQGALDEQLAVPNRDLREPLSHLRRCAWSEQRQYAHAGEEEKSRLDHFEDGECKQSTVAMQRGVGIRHGTSRTGMRFE